MTKVKRIIIGILLLSFCLTSFGCKKKKEAFNHEVLRAAAKSYGATELEDLDSLLEKMKFFEELKARGLVEAPETAEALLVERSCAGARNVETREPLRVSLVSSAIQPERGAYPVVFGAPTARRCRSRHS